MQKTKGNHHKMSNTHEGSVGVENKTPIADVKNNTPEGSSSIADVENNSENPSALKRMGRAAVEAVKGIVRVATNRNGSAERLGINTKKATGVDVDSAAAEGVLSSDSSAGDSEKDSREGISNGLTPKEVEALRKYARAEVISTPEEQASDSTKDASGSSAEKNIPVSEPPEPSLPKSVTKPGGRQYPAYPEPSLPKSVTKPDGRQYPAEIEPPKPTPDELDRIKQKDEAAAAKYSSSVNPDVYTRVKGENVIDKDIYGDDEPEKIQETYEAATNLKIARSRFAKASVAVESHFFKKFFGGKKRQAELEAATEQLKQCELEYMSLKFADKIEAAKQDPEKQAELAAEMAQAAFASMQETSRTTTDKYDSMLDDRGKFKKAVAKVGKWFNKGGKIAQWLKLGGAGFVGGAIVGSVATWPITTAVGIVTGLGVAGATKQAVLEEHRGEDRIDADASLGTIDPSFKDTVAKMKIDDVMEHAVNVSVDNLKDVSIERQDDLRKRMRWAMGRFSIGFALGGYAGKFVGDWANSAHATGDSASQSGGKELKTHLLEKVKDAAPGSADPVGNYTPGLDSLYGYDPSKHEFLWQWAESVYGEGNGTSGIMHTVDVLRNNGYIVDIINNPNGSFSVVVDGVSDTEGLVKIFSQFVN